MNKDVVSNDTPRYEKLSKPRPKIDTTSNFDAFKVKRGALSYQITDTLIQLAQPKCKSGSNINEPAFSLSKNANSTTEKKGQSKLVNSSEQSRRAQEIGKKKHLLDTYARITASNNKRCSKRLRDLAKPKKDSSNMRGNVFTDFDTDYQTPKLYNPKSPVLEKRKM